MIKEGNSEDFKELEDNGLVLMDFYSVTCGPCKMLGLVLNDVEKELGDELSIIKLDFEQNQELADRFFVTGFPTLILLKDGKEVGRLKGLQQKKDILQLVALQK